MRTAVAIAVAALLSTTLAAAPIGKVHVIPTAPTNLNPIRVTFAGRPITAPAVRIEEGRIELRFLQCDPTANALPRQDTVLLGTLPAGSYIVVVTACGEAVQEFPLQVRDVTTIPMILPWIRPGSNADAANHAVTEWRTLGSRPPRFRIGGQPAQTAGFNGYVSIYPTAPLPPGLHDVEVTWPDGKVDVARNAVEVLTSGDSSTFGERLLLPVLLTGRGADGTAWSSSLDIEALDSFFMTRSVDNDTAPRGVFREHSPRYERRRGYHTRVQPDPPNGTWTPLPVVEETEFRPSMRITEVSGLPGRRTTLRLYSVEPARVTISGSGFVRQAATTGGGPVEPAYASVDLSADLTGPGDLVLHADAPIWALVSVFDLGTRELMIRTP